MRDETPGLSKHRYIETFRVVGLLYVDSVSRRTRVTMLETPYASEATAYLGGFIPTLGPGEQAIVETVER